MKANELRIGNWVYPARDIKEVQVLPNDFQDTDFLTPIPLTEEWLIKFGLKRSDTDRHRFFICGVDVYIFTDNNGTHTSIHFNPSEPVLSLELNHVHQLQNLYHSLTGEELTLD